MRTIPCRIARVARISARWTRQRPWMLPIAFVWHHRSMVSVHSSAASYCALGASQPAAHRRHQGSVDKQVHRDAYRRCSCSDPVAGLHALRVRPFPRVDRHVEVAGGVGDLAEKREISGTEASAHVRLHQEVERLLPRSARRRVACAPGVGLVTGGVTAVTVALTHLV